MNTSRKMLYETLVGHFALLQSTHPRKAATNIAKRARRHVKMSLRRTEPSSRRMAA
jgi:hypothetical protein